MRTRKSNSGKKPGFKSEICTVQIDHIATQGDGVGYDDQGRKFFVPYSLAGDRLQVKTVRKTNDAIFARIEDILSPGTDRVAPPCPHFAKCGGCSLQHLKEESYHNHKKQTLLTYLARASLEAPELQTHFIGPRTRRRVSFGVMKKGKKIIFGFHEKASNRLVEITRCLILDPMLEQLIYPLRERLRDILKQEGQGDIMLTRAETGLDLHLVYPGVLSAKSQESLIEFANHHQIHRITHQKSPKDAPELIAGFAPLQVHFGKVALHLPMVPFLQPSIEGQEAMSRFVEDALDKEKRLLDLYAGCGSFSFAIAQNHHVHCVEINSSALKALEQAAGRHQLGGRVTTETRDLDRQPYSLKELEKYEAVLFDPPRAGAKAQCEELARSEIPLIIAISCNPATFVRDASQLVAGGYKIEKLVLFDQFTWSSHIELGCVFRK